MRRSAALSAPPAGPATPTRRPLRADAQRNYERLIGAARSVLAERGSEASMEEIAKRADVGVGTLYRHFPRRIDLVEAVYREDVESLVTLADSARAYLRNKATRTGSPLKAETALTIEETAGQLV